jgi:tRNA(Ile)-lysidine synthase
MLPLTPITDYHLLEPFSKDVVAASQHAEPPCIIRPLLETARADVEAYCNDYDLEPRFDRSNLDTTYFRNRLRHDLLPVLETYNPNVKARLCHTAAVVAADYELLAGLAAQAWNDTVQDVRQERVVFAREAWQALPVGLQRATLRRAVHHLRQSLRDVDFVHVEDARRVALHGQTGAQATLPRGLVLVVGYDMLIVGSHGDAGLPPPDGPLLWGDEPVVVQVPGVTPLPAAPPEARGQPNWVLEADLLDTWDLDMVADADPWVAYLDAAALATPLVLRGRRRGERFRPQGMEGHRVKVSDYLVNRKVPRAWRDHLPLLVSGDVILWVCGHSVAAEGAVGEETQKVARLRFDRL